MCITSPLTSVARLLRTSHFSCVSALSRGAATSPSRSDAVLNELYMRAIEPSKRPERPRPSAEELARDETAAKLYTKLMWRRERVLGRDFHRKLKLKWAAIHALPTLERRVEALLIDPYVPFQLRVPTYSPPLAGFHAAEEREKAAAAAAAAAAEAARTSRGKRRGGGAGGGPLGRTLTS